jgi:hypothetical protein
MMLFTNGGIAALNSSEFDVQSGAHLTSESQISNASRIRSAMNHLYTLETLVFGKL